MGKGKYGTGHRHQHLLALSPPLNGHRAGGFGLPHHRCRRRELTYVEALMARIGAIYDSDVIIAMRSDDGAPPLTRGPPLSDSGVSVVVSLIGRHDDGHAGRPAGNYVNKAARYDGHGPRRLGEQTGRRCFSRPSRR